MSDKYKRWLMQETPKWVREGIVSAETVERLRAYYGVAHGLLEPYAGPGVLAFTADRHPFYRLENQGKPVWPRRCISDVGAGYLPGHRPGSQLAPRK